MSLVRLDAVSFAYGSNGSVGAPLVGARRSAGRHEGRPYALRDVSLAIAPRELVLVVGHAGAGTSTLLLVCGGYAPRLTGGELSGSRTVAANHPAIVFATPWTQLTGLCHTVFAEVAFGPASFAKPAACIRDVVQQALFMLGIAHLSDRDPATLSGGELQRVIVASALALEPDLLLLDDPAAELDPEAADSLYDLLQRIAGSGTAVMVATPDLERGTRVASRALVLQSGRVVHDGSPAQVPT